MDVREKKRALEHEAGRANEYARVARQNLHDFMEANAEELAGIKRGMIIATGYPVRDKRWVVFGARMRSGELRPIAHFLKKDGTIGHRMVADWQNWEATGEMYEGELPGDDK